MTFHHNNAFFHEDYFTSTTKSFSATFDAAFSVLALISSNMWSSFCITKICSFVIFLPLTENKSCSRSVALSPTSSYSRRSPSWLKTATSEYSTFFFSRSSLISSASCSALSSSPSFPYPSIPRLDNFHQKRLLPEFPRWTPNAPFCCR